MKWKISGLPAVMQTLSFFVIMELTVLGYSLAYNKHTVKMAGTIASTHPALEFYHEQSPP